MARHWFLTIGGVIGEVESWRPRNCNTEIEYRNSLYNKLEDAFPVPPTKEYGHGRVKADIAFETKVGIELKMNLTSPAKLQRLKGQLDDYARTFGKTIVVLVGKHDRDLVRDLRRAADEYGIGVIEK